MKEANTHRLHWQTFDGATRKKTAAHQDFPSGHAARAARQNLLISSPGVVATVTPVIRKNRERREKIGPGHPEYQGERRVTR